MKTNVLNNWWMILANLIILSIAVVILSACGGGGSGGDSGSSSTSGLSSGEIEGFGSVIINGVKFEVEGAEVETEHGVITTITSTTQEDHLHKGMHIEVEGSFDDNGQTGTATRIIINDEVEGVVSSASATGTDVRTFTVLGQNIVAVAGSTLVFDENDPLVNSTIDDIGNDDFVEVHGLPDGDGNIQATFIKIEDLFDLSDDNLDELTGTIDTGTLNDNVSFEVNGQVVTYTNAVVDAPPLQEGMLVEVKGTLNGSNELVASNVHVEDGISGNLAKAEVEGLIRDLTVPPPTSGQFTLNGQVVEYSGSTLFYNGIKDDLNNGIKVEAEGPIFSGILVANKIKFKDSFRYEGMVTDGTTELTISVPGPSAVSTLRVIIDSSVSDVDGSVNYANPVKVRARIVSGSTLIATRVDSGGNNDRQIFEAPVVDFSDTGNMVELLDDGTNSGVGLIEVNTSNMAENLPLGDINDSDFKIEDSEVTRVTFYGALNVGDRVKARHRNSDWDEIEIEIED